MQMPSDDREWSELRNKIIGLGEHSQKKSYYPELKRRFNELEKFKTLLDNSNDFIFLIEMKEFKIADINETACNLLNYKKNEIKNHSAFVIISKEVPDKIKTAAENYSPDNLKNSFTTKLIKKDGSNVLVEITFSEAVFKDENYLILVARDITERIKNEEAVKNSESNLRTVFNSSRDAMIIHDEKGNVVEVNDPMLKLYGVNRLSFQKYNIADYSSSINNSDYSIFPLLAEVIKGNELLFTWKAKKPVLQQEFWAEVFMRKIIWYGKDMILAIIRDITDKKNTEDALHESEKKYRMLFEKMLDAFCICEGIFDDNENMIDIKMLDVNPAYEKMYNLKKEDLVGEYISRHVKIQDDYWLKVYEKVIKTGESVFIENYSSAWEKYYSIAAFKYKEKQFAIVFEDITERKKAEYIINKQLKDLENKNTEMERFTYTVSHDLRSPLITIKGFAATILEDAKIGKYDRIEADINRIENAADKMNNLLEDLLEISRIGRIVNPPTEFSMSIIGHEVKELLHGIIEKKNINFIIQDNMPAAYGDVHRIREVIQNLVENAVKFMNNNLNPEIKIGSYTENEEVVYYVKDNGPGIDEKNHEKIFGLFDKLNPNTEGTGIGLAIVKRIVEIHGGTIRVKSSLGNGTEFCFTLKLNKI